MSDNESFDQALRDTLDRLAAQRGPCPTVENLVAYQAGQMAPEWQKDVREHVLLCADCELALERLDEFDRSAAAMASPVPKRQRNPMIGFLWNPALGYLLALALVYPAYRGYQSMNSSVGDVKPERQRQASLVPARVFELRQNRGSDTSYSSLRLGHGEDLIILSFFVPAQSNHSYFAEIRDAASHVVAPRQKLIVSTLGDTSIQCACGSLKDGAYQLVATEASAGGSTVAQFFYGFEIRSQAR